MAVLRIRTPRAFKPFLAVSRYKGAFGGRGSGKSHNFAELLIERCLLQPTRWACIRQVQNSMKESVHRLLCDKIDGFGLSRYFQILDNEIRTPGDGVIIFKGMQHFNEQTIKSLEGYDGAWVEEAQTLRKSSLDVLRPTIRKTGSELWFTWNPVSEFDAVDEFFRGKHRPDGAIVQQVNWYDNPWFPDTLEAERRLDMADPVKYEHVWEGGYRQAAAGSYYGALLAKARIEGRICRVPPDPGLEVHVAFDLGVGKNMALWLSQWTGREIRVIGFLEGDDDAAAEGLAWYGRKLRALPYTYAPLILPHDAASNEIGGGATREKTLRDLGFRTRIVPKMAPEDRIELVKRQLPKMYFDQTACGDGLKLLKDYREDWDEKNRVSRGPKHDYTSHAADALGHLCQGYEEPQIKRPVRPKSAPSATAWMG